MNFLKFEEKITFENVTIWTILFWKFVIVFLFITKH